MSALATTLPDDAPRPPMDVARAARTSPELPEIRQAIAVLSRRDEASWRALVVELTAVARALASSFSDVTTPDDTLGDLALHAHERWIDEWLDRAERGEARVPLLVFLRDRMRDQLREERRRRIRRAELLRAMPETTLHPAGFDAPDDAMAANELREKVTAGSPALDTVVKMREAGLDQREIARRTGRSPATISRNLAALAAVLAPLVAIALLVPRLGRETPTLPTHESAQGAETTPATDTAPTATTGVPIAEPASAHETVTPPAPAPRVAVPTAPLGAPAYYETGDSVETAQTEGREPQAERETVAAIERGRAERPPTEPEPTPTPAVADPAPATATHHTAPRPRVRSTPATGGASVSPQASATTGTLLVNAVPWCRLSVDGREIGPTPQLHLELAPGRHVLRCVAASGEARTTTVEVRAGETSRVLLHVEGTEPLHARRVGPPEAAPPPPE